MRGDGRQFIRRAQRNKALYTRTRTVSYFRQFINRGNAKKNFFFLTRDTPSRHPAENTVDNTCKTAAAVFSALFSNTSNSNDTVDSEFK